MENELAFPSLDKIFFNYKELMCQPELANKVRSELIQATFQYHLKNNCEYRQYATRLGISDCSSLVHEVDIPLLPSAFFKGFDFNIATVPKKEIIKYCTSSGTQGSLSIVPRDETTLMHFLSSIAASFPALLQIDRAGNHRGVVLGPSTEDAGDLWFSYAMACLTLQVTTTVCERNEEFDIDYSVSQIKYFLEKKHDLMIVGPPFRILDICKKISSISNFPPLTSKSFVISAGGWKNRQNQAINKVDFINMVADAFQIKNQSQIRDCFNMVELNTIILECEHHNKHIPPWLSVQARDPRTNKALPEGQSGILAFLDATAVSYPCFILSEDIGTVSEIKCKCGRSGMVVNIEKRMSRIEARGCALKMTTGNKNKAHKDSKDRYFESFYRDPQAYL